MTRISFAACFVLLCHPEILSGGPPQPTVTPLVRVVDLNVGESQAVGLCDGSTATVKLLDLEETRDSVRSPMRKETWTTTSATPW